MSIRQVSLTEARLIEYMVFDLIQQYEQEYDVRTHLPVPLVDIGERIFGLRFDIEVFKGRFSDTLAVLIPEKRSVLINGQQHYRQETFSIAHELAHWIVEYHPWGIEGKRLGSFPGLFIKNKRKLEKVIDYLAGVLLVPSYLLLGIVDDFNHIDSEYIRNLARFFGVSNKVMQIRLDQIRFLVDYRYLDDLSISQGSSIINQKNSLFNYKVQPRYIIAIVHTNILDHNLFRKLLGLKQLCDNLFIMVFKNKMNIIEGLREVIFIDGFLIIENFVSKALITREMKTSDDAINFVTIDSERWEENILRDLESTDFRASQKESVFVITRKASPIFGFIQQELMDLSRFIVPKEKLNNRSDATDFINREKASGKRVVIVTGIFDLVHIDHVSFLKRAKQLGDSLVVGLEDDTRVRVFKPPPQPINTISQRIELIQEFDCVDFTFVIHGSPKRPLKPFYTKLLSDLNADILAVSEGDPHLLDRQDEIESAGGELVVLPRGVERSTRSIVRTLLDKMERTDSDLMIVSRRQLEELINGNRRTWQQLILPLGNE